MQSIAMVNLCCLQLIINQLNYTDFGVVANTASNAGAFLTM